MTEENPEKKIGVFKKVKADVMLYLIKKVIKSKFTRDTLMGTFEKKLYTNLINDTNYPKAVQEKKFEFLRAMMACAVRNIDKGYISQEVWGKIADNFVKQSFLNAGQPNETVENFKKKYGIPPSSFLVLSPTQKCNLNCVGCYASARANAPTLPFDVVEKIADQAYNLMGHRFMTISGGEPFMYNDKGKTLFDIFKKYPKMFFLVYTNSTLINKEVAKKLAECANVTPAISVEGFEAQTDERRGKGIHKRILEAMKNLREAGVPFGISVTATSCNYEVLMGDEFYEFFFKEQGASYMWMFQLMPIGQAKDMKKLMISPKQRVNLYQKWKELLHDKKYCVADFWNSGVLSNGCIAYARSGGYFYIDWNGNIMPCVFVPYYEDNVMDLFKKGKTLGDAIQAPLFKRGREWQENFGLKNPHKAENWLAPCSIRDHWMNFKKNILTNNSKPEDKCAEEAMNSKEYDKNLIEFDDELEKLTVPIWKKELEEGEKKFKNKK